MPSLPLALIVAHFVGDFVLQNDWMAQNKSSRCWPLTVHVSIYSAAFLLLEGWQFAGVTFVLHWATDFMTSCINTAIYHHELRVGADQLLPYWATPSHHWFFVGVGADQVLHYLALGYTLELLSA